MHAPTYPITKDVVLIGGGHTHALVLKSWGMKPLAGARLTVINPGPTAPYSGMLPGFVAGHYAREDLDIDLVQLGRFANARLILGHAEHIDRAAQLIHVPGQPPIAYDVASIDIGITSSMPQMPGFSDHAVPAKPLGPFAARWNAFRQGNGPAHVAVIGGGVAGVELILAMAHALRQRGRLASATLIDNDTALTALPENAQKIMRRHLTIQQVSLVEHAEIAAITPGLITLSDGREILSDFTTGAAGARPYDWIENTGLSLTHGFVDVDPHLQSSDPQVFATGDCAHFSADPRPKAGVYAVRQAPVLFANLRASLTGDQLRPYKPQKDYLKLISLGAKEALGEKFGLPFHGRQIWRWKHSIDQSFMGSFRDLMAGKTPDLPAEHTQDLPDVFAGKPMCGGCGAKVARTALMDALPPSGTRSDITHLPGDDAAVITIGGAQQVITTDHLRAFVQDPITMARITAVHALGDIWAMGATPQAATASITLPQMNTELQRRTLAEIMQAAGEIISGAGADIVGGHSAMGSELTIGFTITGLCERAPITLAGGKAGDVLILTKPLGTGILMAAEMAGLAAGDHIAAALKQMSRPQAQAAKTLAQAHAMTDVTGFGLLGHLKGICDASQCGAEISPQKLPLLAGVAALSANGMRSSLYPENRALLPELCAAPEVLFDPQTSGGLLAAVDPASAPALLQELLDQGEHAAIFGRLTDQPGQITLAP